MTDYVLKVGSKGFDRLRFLDEVFGEHSRSFLRRAGITAGQRVLEVGCGTGSMTTWIARQVGETGSVVAVDASEAQIDLARQAAREAGLTNISFLCSTVEALELEESSVDLVYSRLLLMHLKDAAGVLRRLKVFVRRNGTVACEEPQAGTLETVPRSETIDRLNDLFIRLGRLQGFDVEIGRDLWALLDGAGYVGLQGCFVQPVIPMAKAVEFILMNAAELAPVAERTGLLGGDEARRILSELQSQRCDDRAYYVFPRQAQVFGVKGPAAGRGGVS